MELAFFCVQCSAGFIIGVIQQECGKFENLKGMKNNGNEKTKSSLRRMV